VAAHAHRSCEMGAVAWALAEDAPAGGSARLDLDCTRGPLVAGPREPASQRALAYLNPGHRPLNVHEPQLPAVPAEVFDTPPVELTGDVAACDEWIRLASMLRAARQVTDAERGSLIALVQQWSRYLEANTKAAAAGMVIKSPSGYPMPNPYLSIANRALAHCMKLWAELGLTPSSRSRVTATPATSAMDTQKQRYFGAARGR
jgi:P27 family predicted phage terminase small subunit